MIYRITDGEVILGTYNTRHDALFELCQCRIYINTLWLTLPEAGFYIEVANV
jgi:hypothetical protein